MKKTVFLTFLAFVLSISAMAQPEYNKYFWNKTSKIIKDKIIEELNNQNRLSTTKQGNNVFFVDIIKIEGGKLDIKGMENAFFDEKTWNTRKYKANYIFRPIGKLNKAQIRGTAYYCLVTVNLKDETFKVEFYLNNALSFTATGKTFPYLNKKQEAGIYVYFLDNETKEAINGKVEINGEKPLDCPFVFLKKSEWEHKANGKLIFKIKKYENDSIVPLLFCSGISEKVVEMTKCKENEVNHKQNIQVYLINEITGDTINNSDIVMYWNYNSKEGIKELKNTEQMAQATWNRPKNIEVSKQKGFYLIDKDFKKRKVKRKKQKVYLYVFENLDNTKDKKFFMPPVRGVKLSCSSIKKIPITLKPKYVSVEAMIMDTTFGKPQKLDHTQVKVSIEGERIYNFEQKGYHTTYNADGRLTAKIPYRMYDDKKGKIKINIKSINEDFKNEIYYDQTQEITFTYASEKYTDTIFAKPDTRDVKIFFFDPFTENVITDTIPFKIQENNDTQKDNKRELFVRELQYNGNSPMVVTLPKYVENFNLEHTRNEKKNRYEKSHKVFINYNNNNPSVYVYYIPYEPYNQPDKTKYCTDGREVRRKFLEKEKFCIQEEQHREELKNEIDTLSKVLEVSREAGLLYFYAADYHILRGKLAFMKYKYYGNPNYLTEDARLAFLDAQYANQRMEDTETINQWLREIDDFNEKKMWGCLDCSEEIAKNGEYKKFAIKDAGICSNQVPQNEGKLIEFITKKGFLNYGTCTPEMPLNVLTEEFDFLRGTNEEKGSWILPLLRGIIKFQEFKTKSRINQLSYPSNEKEIQKYITDIRNYFTTARDSFPVKQREVEPYNKLFNQIQLWVDSLQNPIFEGCTDCKSPFYNPFAVSGNCPEEKIKKDETKINEKINEDNHLAEHGYKVELYRNGVNMEMTIIKQDNTKKIKASNKYKTGRYYDEAYLQVIKIAFDFLKKEHGDDLKIRGEVIGQADGQRIKRKGLPYKVLTKYGGNKIPENTYFGTGSNITYYSAEPGPLNLEKALNSKVESYKIIKKEGTRIYENKELAFIRAFIVQSFIQEVLDINTGNISLIAKQNTEIGEDYRSVSINFTIETGYKPIQKKRIDLLDTELSPLFK